MPKSALARLTVVTTAQCEEPVAALLERLFATTPAIYTDLEKGHSLITVYGRAGMRELRQREAELTGVLQQLRDMDLDLGSAEVIIRNVRREDWSESWKKHFKTIEIGRSLVIKPSWSKQKPKRGQATVVLDPGLSFGTGQHATTSFCLKEIAAAQRTAKRSLSLLDAGCGSGILAISAAKLGFTPIEAFDFDPVAARIARKNCRSNRVENKVRVSRLDLTKMPLNTRRKFDLVCANLISDLLISERARLLNRLAPGGTLALAGILETEFPKVRDAYEATGLTMIRTKVEREWQSGSFRAV